MCVWCVWCVRPSWCTLAIAMGEPVSNSYLGLGDGGNVCVLVAWPTLKWARKRCVNIIDSPTPQVAGLENMFEFEHVLSPKRSATPHRELHHRLTKEEGVREGHAHCCTNIST